MVTINFQKRDLWLLAAIMVFFVAVSYVIAYGSNQPSVMGHSFNEIELPSCSDGQVLKNVSGNWVCSYDTCGVSGDCSQICIGSNCRSTWPSPVQTTSCPAGYYATVVSSTGTFTCTPAYVNANDCERNGHMWSVGAICCIPNYRYVCTTSGWQNTGASCGSWPAC